MVRSTKLQPVVVFVLALLLAKELCATGVPQPMITRFGDQEDTFNPKDFVFDLQGSEPAVDSDGGKMFVMSQENTPGLRLGAVVNRGGGEQVLFNFEPCGFRTPHFHPRGVENFHVISGKIAANFISESGNLIMNNVTAGFSGFFPLAHVHFLQNIGCKPAITLSILDNMDPGVYDVASVLNLQPDTIQLTLGDKKLRANQDLIEDVLQQSAVCLKRCGLSSEQHSY